MAFSFILSLAQILQTAFLVAIIIEVFKLFGTLKGRGNASGATDWAVNAGKKLFGQTEEQKQKRQERAARKERELEEETKRLEELGKYLGTLSFTERDSLDKVEQGINILKQLQEDKDKLTNPQIITQLKNTLAEQLGDAAKSLFDTNYKRMRTNNTFRKQNHIKQDIDDLEKEFNNIGKSIDDELTKSVNNMIQLKKTFGKDAQELQSF